MLILLASYLSTDLSFEDVPLLESVYLVFTRMPVESYCTRLGSLLLCSCDIFRALINSLFCCCICSCLSVYLFFCLSSPLSVSVYLSVCHPLSVSTWLLSNSICFTGMDTTLNIVCICRVLYFFSICLLDDLTTWPWILSVSAVYFIFFSICLLDYLTTWPWILSVSAVYIIFLSICLLDYLTTWPWIFSVSDVYFIFSLFVYLTT